MMERTGKILLGVSVLSVAAVGVILTTTRARAQGGYEIGEKGAAADAGPVRLARVSYLTGPVTWRPSSNDDWSSASTNLPLRQGAQVWVKGGSRSELQFDDGSTLRLGGGAVCSLPTMYSDDRGEFTEIKLNSGLATLHLRNKLSEYQVDTPLSSVKCYGPAEVRVGVGKTVEVACLAGRADIDGQQGTTALYPHQRLDILNPTDPYDVTEMPAPDQWDRFNDNRDVVYTHHNLHVPDNIDLVAGDLDSYGAWHDDPNYGYVWAPRVAEAGWRPYHHGRWVWVSPWGWTWVGDEPWGWAPYHYGTWVDEPYGWAWCPGPAVQYWSPAVVDFVDEDPYVGWAPLAPGEVVYPNSINIGFRTGNWWLNFSIGGAAAYYPAGPRYCEARPWDNVYVNRQVNVYNVTNIYGHVAPDARRYFVRNSPFVPRNAVRYAGMTRADHRSFMEGGHFQAVAADPRGNAFRQGRSFASAPGRWQVSGPPSLRPTRNSFTPTHQYARAGGPPPDLLQRNIVRDHLPAAIASRNAPMSHVLRPTDRRAAIVHSAMPPVARTSTSHFTAALRRSSTSGKGPSHAGPGARPQPNRGGGSFVRKTGRFTNPPVRSQPRPSRTTNAGGKAPSYARPGIRPGVSSPRPRPQPNRGGGSFVRKPGHFANPPVRSQPRPSRTANQSVHGGTNMRHQVGRPQNMGPQPRRVGPGRPYSQPTRHYQPPRSAPRQNQGPRPSRPAPQRPPRQGGSNGGGTRGHGRHGG